MKTPAPPLTPKQKQDIIFMFVTTPDNSTAAISEKLKISKYQVSTTINLYLTGKR